MADRSSGKLTVAELMARMGDASSTSEAETRPPSRATHARSEELDDTAGYVPRRLRGTAAETPQSDYSSSSYTPTDYRSTRREEPSTPRSSFSWTDIVQDADWSAADKLEAWPHRATGPDTADNPTQRIPAVDDDVSPRRSPKSPSTASLLDTYSSDFSSGRQLATAAHYPEEDDRYPYTAGMDVLSAQDVASAQAQAAEEQPAEDAAVDADTPDKGASPAGKFFHKVKAALGRDTSDENLAATTRVLQLAQIVITAVVGGLLFWGFGVLWSKPGLGMVTFALALIVQVAMVVVARVLRRREEFWVLILTFIVAFFVTVGPLIITP